MRRILVALTSLIIVSPLAIYAWLQQRPTYKPPMSVMDLYRDIPKDGTFVRVYGYLKASNHHVSDLHHDSSRISISEPQILPALAVVLPADQIRQGCFGKDVYITGRYYFGFYGPSLDELHSITPFQELERCYQTKGKPINYNKVISERVKGEIENRS